MKEPPESLPQSPGYSLPPGVGQGRVLPPQNRMGNTTTSGMPSRSRSSRSSPPRGSTDNRPRSNLSALMDQEYNNNRMRSVQQQNREREGASYMTPVVSGNSKSTAAHGHCEADSASGPNTGISPHRTPLVRSAPSHMDTLPRSVAAGGEPGVALPTSFAVLTRTLSTTARTSRGGAGLVMPVSGRVRAQSDISSMKNTEPIRRCLSSKELGTLAPPSGSPYADILHQRELIEASLQQRLDDVRKTPSVDRSLTPSLGENENESSCDSSSRKRTSRSGRNENRNKRRAEHNRAVIEDLCEIVTDLFAAEGKLLNPRSYGVDTAVERDQFLLAVKNFVSALPPRYALGVETPSEVLVHMRLMAAARADNTKTVVHISNLEDGHWGDDGRNAARGFTGRSRHLVTISCADVQGLLEYITKLLATGGSRVLDADIMQSKDNIVLDRFVVEMNGRLRLDRLANSIEAFLAGAVNQDQTSHSSSSLSASAGASPRPATGTAPSGPLYFKPDPTQNQDASPTEIEEEIESAVPLVQVIAASTSNSNLFRAEDLVPMRGSYSPKLRRGGSMPTSLLQPVLPTATGAPIAPLARSESASADDTSRRRPLVNRESTFGMEEVEAEAAAVETAGMLDFVTVPAQPLEADQEDHIVPIIPFEELMLIETLGMGRVSTIYRAAWQSQSIDRATGALTNVKMVALKVATINPDTGDTSHVNELRQEADIAAMLNHPNVCDLVGIAADAECFCLAYEFCEGGSLLSLLSNTSRYYEYLPIALDIANGMAYLHARNVIHRDLKPSNVLLSRDHRAQIADFGMSVANKGQELTAETGTYRYMAPEVIRHESYSSNADVYSFGIVLWQLITREVPFATMTPIQAAFSVAEGRRPEIPPSCPLRLREILEACWDQDSHKRPSFTYVAMQLADYARMAFSPANVGAQTLQIANEMLANVEGNSTVNVDFSTPVATDYRNTWMGSGGLSSSFGHQSSTSNVGLEI